MNILQFNVRLAEGGAAGVALDLHQRALQQGLASHFVYGYGKGGKESVSHQNYPQVIKHTPRMTAMANIALFRLFNRDLFGNFNELYRTITRTPGPVVLHFHVLHSYWLNLKSVVRFCEKVKNHKPDVTLVWTLHDHWSVTGRCAFTDGCEGWKTGCQKCPTLINYPPVKIDRAHQLVAGKRQLFREMLALGCQFISPASMWLTLSIACTVQGVAGLSIMALIWQPKRFWRTCLRCAKPRVSRKSRWWRMTCVTTAKLTSNWCVR